MRVREMEIVEFANHIYIYIYIFTTDKECFKNFSCGLVTSRDVSTRLLLLFLLGERVARKQLPSCPTAPIYESPLTGSCSKMERVVAVDDVFSVYIIVRSVFDLRSHGHATQETAIKEHVVHKAGRAHAPLYLLRFAAHKSSCWHLRYS